MISIQVGLKKIKQINCIIGYSGKIINQKHLSTNINSRPKIFLMHGEKDEIVLPTNLLDAKEYLVHHKLKVKTKGPDLKKIYSKPDFILPGQVPKI